MYVQKYKILTATTLISTNGMNLNYQGCWRQIFHSKYAPNIEHLTQVHHILLVNPLAVKWQYEIPYSKSLS